MTEFYIGLMSGTSIDGIDAGLVDFSSGHPEFIAFEYHPFPDRIRTELTEITSSDHPVLLKNIGKLDTQLGSLFAQSAQSLIAKAGFSASDITAIGSHGHTLFHAPELPNPFCLQIGDPNIIAQLTGITTVADFRRRDIAAGGQGAPLVPAFHQALFGYPGEHRVITNIGGIANITILPNDSSKPVIGFDTGPGNSLMDTWIKKHRGSHFDHNGDWARTGQVNKHLLSILKADTYFKSAAPKSTGKEYFSLGWLTKHLREFSEQKPEDVQACLCQLTAETICDGIRDYAPCIDKVLVCGGGARNSYLLEKLQDNLNCPVLSTEEYHLHPDHVEAIAFAWLARQTMNSLPGNLMSVTGAKQPVILGGIYPGRAALCGK
ncbi:MAG: anhydro-N-acetylmuramic acid kinase [Gammaproteobacteria bacterium HGW-Gammaproteobacteria-10]|nr:MAG: anhydro-N-acetylmuramic acid kinase [Gammaproteobacteria bacterium HGW-Gammaproteobacteria-10]